MKRAGYLCVGICFIVMMCLPLVIGCSGSTEYIPLLVEEVDPANPGDPGDGDTDTDDGFFQDVPSSGEGGMHAIFSGILGIPISDASLKALAVDPTGFIATDDYDGDGIPNDREITTNPYVADYPRIVTRISAPITMEIRISETSSSENHTETVEDTDVKNTISNSMEDKQYSQMNQKTTPYVTKESYANSGSHSDAYGYNNSDASSYSASGSLKISGLSASSEASFSMSGSHSSSRAENWNVADSFSKSDMSEKTVFQDVDYRDNLDRNGIEFTDSTVQNMSKNYRKSEVLKNTQNIGPNAGVVRAALFIKNMTVNMPVKVSNLICTLSFRTPSGEFLPVKSFRLRNDDWQPYAQEIYGGEEFGPYTIEVADLNTAEVRKALANGYVPQIHVVSYDLCRVPDSNYNPGVDNLKIVEETAKGRTATIKISGKQMRDIYRVCAFDVETDGSITPGISLKKALFNMLRDQIGKGEMWENDTNGKVLTIGDTGLKWKADAADSNNYVFTGNTEGNSWRTFETYVKSYVDEFNQVHRVETIKRIGPLKKYNPFDTVDNPSYNPNELLSENEIYKMKYWVILHNGKYYEGDLNDPIWAGDRYEIVCLDIEDFNKHYTTFSYTPLQSMESFYLDTRWNKLTNAGEFSRAKLMGKVLKGDVIHLEVDLVESRFLNDPAGTGQFSENPHAFTEPGGFGWNQFNYAFQPATVLEQGIPKEFSHSAAGGTNNITVNIAESQFAHEYEISFRDAANAAAPWKRVKLAYTEYQRNSGAVTITRNTNDVNGVPVGIIAGTTEYLVNVKANGMCYGVPVYTNSMNNSQVRATVSNAGGNPTAFSFNAAGTLNNLHLRIADAPGAEYYVIQLEGPLNGEYSGSLQTTTLIGHSGGNIIDILNPTGAVDVVNPGVYRVEVFAVNDTCLGGGTAAHNNGQYITVNYERYSDQKIYSPKKSLAYYDLGAIDLEVNFNDGSGWYRLKLSANDTAPRTIDCRYTSYIEYDKQKFHVFFKPPAGADTEYSSIFDVFMGGRDEVDMYVRTVPRREYRDTFWLKPGQDPDMPEGSSFVFTGNDVTSFMNYWLDSELTDASAMEDTLEDREFSTLPPGDGGFALVDGGKGDYFFSPLEQRVYRLKASITDTLNTQQVQQLEQPDFTAAAGDRRIEIINMDSQYADAFVVYWKPGTSVGLYEDVLQYPWHQSETVSANGQGLFNYTISNLTKNQNYVVAVKGESQYGYSPPRFYLDNLGTTGTIEVNTLVPYSNDPPEAPQSISLNLGADGRSIVVSGIHVPGENRYKVFWKTEAETAWSNYYIQNAGFNPYSFVISDLLPWERYLVKACAVTGSDVEGVKSVVGVVDTRTNDGVSASVVWLDSHVTIVGGNNYYHSSLGVNYVVLPEGTIDYKIEGLIDGFHYELYQQTVSFSEFFSSNWKPAGNNEYQLWIDKAIVEGALPTGFRHKTFQALNLTITCRNNYGELKIYSLMFDSAQIGYPVWP